MSWKKNCDWSLVASGWEHLWHSFERVRICEFKNSDCKTRFAIARGSTNLWIPALESYFRSCSGGSMILGVGTSVTGIRERGFQGFEKTAGLVRLCWFAVAVSNRTFVGQIVHEGRSTLCIKRGITERLMKSLEQLCTQSLYETSCIQSVCTSSPNKLLNRSREVVF